MNTHIRVTHPSTKDFICEYHIGENQVDDYMVVTKHGKTAKVYIGKLIVEFKYEQAKSD